MKRLFSILLILAALVAATPKASAQCAMCKSNLEKAREDGGTMVGNTLNSGILYLLALPYSIAAVFGVVYYRKYKQKQQAAQHS